MRIKLKELRAEKGWTQTETAFRTGLSVDYVRSLEIGRANPSLKTAIKIKEAFGCNSIDDLIFEEQLACS